MADTDKNEHGQSLVELALSLTFLLLLVGGAVDLGRVFFTYITLRDAAQEGVIYGSYEPLDQCGIKHRIQAAAGAPIDTNGISDGQIFVSYNPSPPTPGGAITVRVAYGFEITMPLLGTFIGGQSFTIPVTITDTVLRTSDTSSTCP
jgi:hypothetical protein